MSVFIDCEVCKKTIKLAPHRLKNNHHTCSKLCLGRLSSRLKGKKVERICVVCNKSIFYKKSHSLKIKNTTCSRKCNGVFKETNYMGKNNPNLKYSKFNHQFFKTVDSELKAYLLGWIASDGHISKVNSISIKIHKKDRSILEKLNTSLGFELKIKDNKRDMVSLTFHSKEWCINVCNLLKITPGKKSHIVVFPSLSNDMIKSFIRGVFDGDGSIRTPSITHRSPEASIGMNSEKMIDGINNHIPNKAHKYVGTSKLKTPYYTLSWSGVNCLDFLGWLYEGAEFRLARKYNLYEDWSMYAPGLYGRGKFDKFKYAKTDPRATIPLKTRSSDSGYDLTLIDIYRVVGDVTYYRTGIKIQPIYGWYFILTGRSSLSKLGYQIANLGIIDRSYVGEIIVPLLKFDKNAPDLQLPIRAAQIIPTNIVHCEFIEVSELEPTERGSGGFGSTGA